MPKLRLTYKKSAVGYPMRQKNTIRALGFHKLYSTIEKEDCESIRGMVNSVSHLVRLEAVE